MTEFSLNELIRDTLGRSKEPDPHVIARRLLAKIPLSERDRLALHGLAERVSLEVRLQRIAAPSSARRAGESRWVRLRRECIRGDWKLFADCTLEDVEWLAADRREQSARLAAVAEYFDGIAARMRAAGAATVADLGDDELEVAA